MIAVAAVYAGFAACALGAIVTLRPLPGFRLPRRRHGLVLIGAGLALSLIGMLWPVSEKQITMPVRRIDDFMPVYQFHEFHSLQVRGTPERIDRAIREVTADEIQFSER